MYEGLKMLHDLCMEKENHMLYKMADGDVLVFNNRRVMHGRRGYTVTSDSTRTLEGGYIDWDEILCRYRTVSDLLRRPSMRR
ncbi:gamma-butyrobetaine dioxygenase-like [Pollicipes pollicipes]|nr:gamma-butyrobetaine dioxygenase-like [Pollicipes pollicipes]XP_037087409.1 gamma-butyrobetaine dioxygenase-like [Pollicipes pollicipes]